MNQPQSYRVPRTKQLVRLSVFIAIIILQSWVPLLGNIPVPPLSITYIHVTVIVATLWLGVKEGMVVGTAWGINSWLRALAAPVSPINATVLNDIRVSILPRLLMPLILVGILALVKRAIQSPRIQAAIAGFCGSFLNTFLVLGAILLFKQDAYMAARGLDQSGLIQALIAIISTNGILEALAATVLTPILYQVTQQFDKRLKA